MVHFEKIQLETFFDSNYIEFLNQLLKLIKIRMEKNLEGVKQLTKADEEPITSKVKPLDLINQNDVFDGAVEGHSTNLIKQ